jgi:hypothetical protein
MIIDPGNVPISSKWVTNQTRPPLLISASAMAMAIARPSRVLVPRPSSSMIARLSPSMFLVAVRMCCQAQGSPSHRRMKAISLISREKLDILLSMLSSIDTRANSLRMIGNVADSAGTKHPICAMI